MAGNEMSPFHKGTKFDKTQHNYIGGKCIGLIMRSILAIVGFSNHRGVVRLRVLEFFSKYNSPNNVQSRRTEILQSYYITLFQQLRQDPPKLMIPQELSTS